ncbi:MAG: imidazoleglycerol-phosphate dehydratase HisB [Oscillospiraceae bacterium]|nr:imidazoleglycerol-phosphate dehydratase HisB [Oscillospiraceae bacterium]
MREAVIERKTAETDIKLYLNLDAPGSSEIDTGCGFLDHMLTLFAKHSGFCLKVSCKGDTLVDYHHTVEDTGICLGLALKEALRDMAGITRYGYAVIPMDEALVLTSVDISGRAYLACNLDIPTQKVGDFDTELCEEFMAALARSAGLTLHIRQLDGRNSHHIIECTFKCLAKSLKTAVSIDPSAKGAVPSTKGVI